MKLRISARRSDLARMQAFEVGKALTRAEPALEIEFLFKESLGDKNQHDPLWKMPAQGVFTEDFVLDLQEGRTDLVVHSWKDLPTAHRPGLRIAATLPRADQRDCLLLRPEARGKANLTLLTSSPRRTFSTEAHLRSLLPFRVEEIATKPVRGNILTRLKKLAAGEGDGLFVAKAALDRLLTTTEEEFRAGREEIRALMDGFLWMVLPLSLFPTAPAQGALAIEIREDRSALAKLLAKIHHQPTMEAVEQERVRFSSFGGGCHQKIGISVFRHERLGPVEFFHGLPDGGSPLHEIRLSERARNGVQGSFWPEGMPSVFAREATNAQNPGGGLFVARAEALPKAWKVEGQPIWTAGTRTWQKLAERGVWVNGTCDALGERLPETGAFLPSLPWTKLTHEDSGNDAVFPCCGTYRLKPKEAAPPLVDSYFWPSESLFRWAIGQRPEIRNARHACGPGYTATVIEKELGRPIDVYYNYAHWRTGNALE